MCLLHEADFSDVGAEGTGLLQIDHFEPQVSQAALVDDYDNCIYTCRHCNRAKWDRVPVNEHGMRLLNPSSAVWAQHFSTTDDRLIPKPGDRDAEYTHATYNIDDPRKVKRRRQRREVIEQHLKMLRECPALRQKLIDLAAKLESEQRTEDAVLCRTTAESMRRDIVLAWKVLQRYRVLPNDHDRACRCGSGIALKLPEALQAQIQDIIKPTEVSEDE